MYNKSRRMLSAIICKHNLCSCMSIHIICPLLIVKFIIFTINNIIHISHIFDAQSVTNGWCQLIKILIFLTGLTRGIHAVTRMELAINNSV